MQRDRLIPYPEESVKVDWDKAVRIYPKVMRLLAEDLDNLENVRRGYTYWETVVGSWLWKLLRLYFEPEFGAQSALARHPQLLSKTNPQFLEDLVSDATSQFSAAVKCLEWRSQLVKVLRGTDFGSYPKQTTHFREGAGLPWRRRATSRTTKGRFLVKILESIFNGRRVLVGQLPMPRTQQILFSLSLGFWPNFYFSKDDDSAARSRGKWELSFRLSPGGRGTDKWPEEARVASLARFLMPRNYVEDRNLIRQLAVTAGIPQNLDVVLLSTEVHTDDVFNHWLGQARAKELKVFGVQHGSHYWTAPYSEFLQHELRVSDYFIAWGKPPSASSEKMIEGPVTRVMGRKQRRHSPRIKGFVFVLGTPLTDGFEYSSAWGPDPSFREQNSSVGRNLIEECDRRGIGVLVRPNPHFPLTMEMLEAASTLSKPHGIVLDDSGLGLLDLLRKSSLTVHLPYSTPFLECMSLNLPCLLLQTDFSVLSTAGFQEDLELLASAGIAHNSPETLLTMLQMTPAEAEEWWLSDSVQRTRNDFCKKYCPVPAGILEGALTLGKSVKKRLRPDDDDQPKTKMKFWLSG